MKVTKRASSLAWFANAVDVLDKPGFIISKEADLSACQTLIDRHKSQGLPATYTLVLIKVLALAIAARPEWKVLLNDNESTDTPVLRVGVSVDYPFPVTPVAVLNSPESKSIAELHRDLMLKRQEAIENQEKLIRLTNSWGRFIPFGPIRKLLLKRILSYLPGRYESVGTFQVSCLPDVDVFIPLMFSTSAILAMGQVRNKRVLTPDGHSKEVPTATVSLVVNHKFWNGRAASDLLNTVLGILEQIPFDS